MSGSHSFKVDAKNLTDKVVAARLRMDQATTTQERQHFEGMARYWEELLAELSTGAGPALN